MSSDEAPATVGTDDIAAMLKLTRKHVTFMARQPGWPAPIINLSRKTRRWALDDVLDHMRRQPGGRGRPRIAKAIEPAAESVKPEAQTFGIIDPDYARVFTQARILAWQYGYACLAHGSFTRDLDLLLVPWTDKAQADDVDRFAPRIAEAAGLTVSRLPPSIKPHGRKAWTLLFPGFADRRWVDLSVMTP